jgi:hypothetical protein
MSCLQVSGPRPASSKLTTQLPAGLARPVRPGRRNIVKPLVGRPGDGRSGGARPPWRRTVRWSPPALVALARRRLQVTSRQRTGVSWLTSGRKQQTSATLLQPGHGGEPPSRPAHLPGSPRAEGILMTARLYPSPAGRPTQESRSPERLQAQHADRDAPAGVLPAAPRGASSSEDTPVYWQTLQVMVAPPGRRGG